MTAADGIARNLYETFIQERSGRGFDEDSNMLPVELRPKFHARVDLYREALLLLALIHESETHREFEQVLQSCESYIFRTTKTVPTASALQKFDVIKPAMDDLARFLSPDGRTRELTWGIQWFRGIGHDTTNPARLTVFALTWMDEYVNLAKCLRELRQRLRANSQHQESWYGRLTRAIKALWTR